MTNVFVEPRPTGGPEGTPVEDFVVEDHADHVLATFKTQEDAIHWARKALFLLLLSSQYRSLPSTRAIRGNLEARERRSPEL